MTTTTTIKQSKRLAGLGLDPATADFAWMDADTAVPLLVFLNQRHVDKRFVLEHGVPAWSLSALLALMPETVTHGHGDYDLRMLKFRDPELGFERYEFSYADHKLASFSGGFADGIDPINAAFDLVCWLLEHDHMTRHQTDIG